MIDTRIIASHGTLHVLAQRAEVLFRDGSACTLHPVRLADAPVNAPAATLRAFAVEGLRWVVVDLERLCPGLRADIAMRVWESPERVIFGRVRGGFVTAGDFTAAAQALATAQWWRTDLATPPAAAAAA